MCRLALAARFSDLQTDVILLIRTTHNDLFCQTGTNLNLDSIYYLIYVDVTALNELVQSQSSRT